MKPLNFLLFNSNSIFASADAAYVLAYSVIMLTTDLHNNQVCLQQSLKQSHFFCPNNLFLAHAEHDEVSPEGEGGQPRGGVAGITLSRDGDHMTVGGAWPLR